MLFMGIDVGTQGVRCVVANERGDIEAAHSAPFARLNIAETSGWLEQSPEAWADALKEAVRACTSAPDRADEIVSVSIDGTSGTIVPLDADFRPLTNGIMYNDPRAKSQAAQAHAALGSLESKLGYKIGASFSLPRILWIRDHLPDVYAKTRVFAHQADYAAGLLTGEFCVSDDSNALKTGYDLIDRRWPEEFETKLNLDTRKLPRIVRPGTPFAHVSKHAAGEYGLPETALVVGGSTDGYASALAAGAVANGRWASIIGTTLVLKGVTERLAIDPLGACYSHRLPNGAWMPGGASNLGGRALNAVCGDRSFDEMNALAENLIPTGIRCYPLPSKGERFPFVLPDALPFYIGDVTGDRLYPAIMEGVAFGERMALERMERIGCEVGDTICTAGGACKSPLWLRIRASVLNKRLIVPASVDAAMGSCLLAASGTFGSLEAAAGAMLRFSDPVEPDARLQSAYAEIYPEFLRDVRTLYHAEV